MHIDISKYSFSIKKNIEQEIYHKKCTICGNYFDTKIKSKNICGFSCKKEHNRQNALVYARKNKTDEKGNPLPCIICGFNETTDMHREKNMTFILCPNHHCLITRGIKTLEQLLIEKGAI